MSKNFTSVNSDQMEWEEELITHSQGSLFKKILSRDDETGVLVQLVKYPAGFINPKHTHTCAHGVYVLKGIFHTSRGNFAPGSFVWFPEGEVMWHGSTKDQESELLFVTNKEFTISYCE
jgi:quercetin dioxygenase-like cupin family protein